MAVYVCGNALPISPQLSPIATYEGDIVARNEASARGTDGGLTDS
jgi:hypothetical protein